MAAKMKTLGALEGLGLVKASARIPVATARKAAQGASRTRPGGDGPAGPGQFAWGAGSQNHRRQGPRPTFGESPNAFRQQGQKALPGGTAVGSVDPMGDRRNWRYAGEGSMPPPPDAGVKGVKARVIPNREGLFGRVADLGDYLSFEGRNLDPGLQRSGIPGLTKHPSADRYAQLWASRGLRALGAPLRILGDHPKKTIGALGTLYGLHALANAGPRAHIPSPPWTGSVVNYNSGGSPWM